MGLHLTGTGRISAALATLALITNIGHADTLLNFEGPDPLGSSLVSGDKALFAATTELAHDGSSSLKFADPGPQPYESWTYDLPFALTSGTVSLWFYDQRGISALQGNPALAKWGGAIILEDKTNPADFGAVEICELPYGPKYYGSEGATDRGVAGDHFDSNSFPVRSAGFHHVEFHITASETKVFVDGLQADEIAAPGSTGNNLRLRIMADSPSNGGRSTGNWYDAPESVSRGKVTDWLYYDDITVTAEYPSSQTHRLDFEVAGETADYDAPGQFQGPDLPIIQPHDNPYMAGFVNQWEAVTSATVAHSGNAAAQFANPAASWKNVVFDLTGAAPGTSVTLWFYDSLGQNGDRNKAGGSIILEEGAAPGNFHALEITNLPYPASGPFNYFLTNGHAGSPGYSDFYSRGFAPRSIGWHKVEIGLYPTYSHIMLDGQFATYTPTSATSPGTIATAAGLDKAPRLRIMADMASNGGFGNYTTVDPLNASYLATREPFVYYDDINIPVNAAGVTDWLNY